MRRIFAVALVSCLWLGGDSLRGANQPEFPKNLSDFMQLKMTHMQNILQGVVLEDFDRVVKNAQDLSLLSQATNWQVLQTPEYLQQSLEFRRSADALRDAAKKKNVDAAALAYVDVAMKCVTCHKYVRNTRMAKLEREPVFLQAFGK